MKPILLKGHERSITCVKYNADGDLLFTTSKDATPTLWRADDGERMGTYNGHMGTVWDLDPSYCSTFVITAGADQKVILFEVETGEELKAYEHGGPVRSVAFNELATKFVSCSDNFSDNPPAVNIFEVNYTNPPASATQPLQQFKLDPSCKATRVAWVNYQNVLDGGILVALEDGRIQILHPESGEILEERQVHSKQVKRLSFNKEKTLLFTASEDCTGKMIDADSLETLKTYETDRPVNAIVAHPTKDHVLLGGGQDAMSVTTTSGKVGKVRDTRPPMSFFSLLPFAPPRYNSPLTRVCSSAVHDPRFVFNSSNAVSSRGFTTTKLGE